MNKALKSCATGLLVVLSCAEAGRKTQLDKRQDVAEHLLKLHNAWLVDVDENAEEGLCEDFKEHFLLGTIYHGKVLGNDRANGHLAEELAITQKEFNAITPENCMKFSFLQPEEGVFTFDEADAFVDEATRMGRTIVGHTLVWKNDAPEWVFKDAAGNPADREVVIDRMVNHIKAVVSRYKGKIEFWDVVNEAVDMLPTEEGVYEPCYKSTPWFDAIGPEYIEIAFRAAHEADPGAKLLYNDYRLISTNKVDFIIDMVKNLRSKGIPVHGIGYQGHMFLDSPEFEELEYVFQACAESGIPLSISELDISVLPNAWKHRGASVEDNFELAKEFNPFPGGAPDAVLEQQARRYRDLFSLCLKYSDTVERVTLWGVWDGNSWRDYKPMEGRTDYPLLFGRNFEKKPAYHALKKLITEKKQ
jgi:endo-1,4-beta-xylanase